LPTIEVPLLFCSTSVSSLGKYINVFIVGYYYSKPNKLFIYGTTIE
jgi:hypothetical protein